MNRQYRKPAATVRRTAIEARPGSLQMLLLVGAALVGPVTGALVYSMTFSAAYFRAFGIGEVLFPLPVAVWVALPLPILVWCAMRLLRTNGLWLFLAGLFFFAVVPGWTYWESLGAAQYDLIRGPAVLLFPLIEAAWLAVILYAARLGEAMLEDRPRASGEMRAVLVPAGSVARPRRGVAAGRI